jgi:hypothetical protein
MIGERHRAARHPVLALWMALLYGFNTLTGGEITVIVDGCNWA